MQEKRLRPSQTARNAYLEETETALSPPAYENQGPTSTSQAFLPSFSFCFSRIIDFSRQIENEGQRDLTSTF